MKHVRNIQDKSEQQFLIDISTEFNWERAVHSVNFACLSWALVKFCVRPSLPFGIEGGMWDVIVLIPDQCLSIYHYSSS